MILIVYGIVMSPRSPGQLLLGKTLTVTRKTIVESNQETIKNPTWTISLSPPLETGDDETVQPPGRPPGVLLQPEPHQISVC